MKRRYNEGSLLWDNDLQVFLSVDRKSYWDKARGIFVLLPDKMLRELTAKRRWRKGPYVSAPVDDWLKSAGKLPGKTSLAVALSIIHETNLMRSRVVVLRNQLLNILGVDPSGKRRGLEALQKAGLIKVERRRGANPTVTLLMVESGEDNE